MRRPLRWLVNGLCLLDKPAENPVGPLPDGSIPAAWLNLPVALRPQPPFSLDRGPGHDIEVRPCSARAAPAVLSATRDRFHRYFDVPVGSVRHWLLVVATAILPLPWLALRSRRLYVRRRRRTLGLCLRCGYDLTGSTSGRCSGCGEHVKAERGDSMRRPLGCAFNSAAVVSAVLFVGVCVLWVRSFMRSDVIRLRDKWVDGPLWKEESSELWSAAGQVRLFHATRSHTWMLPRRPPVWRKSPEPRFSIALGKEAPSEDKKEIIGHGGQEWRTGERVVAAVSYAWVAAGPLVVLAVWVLRRIWRRRRRPGLCPTCGYDMRATPDRCPECGAVPKQA